MTRKSWPAVAAVLLAGAVLSAQAPAPAPQTQPPADPAAQAAPPPPLPQDTSGQPPITFRAEVNYVEVDARVVDAKGAFVPGLAQGDFEVLEDGKPQKVAAFSLVNIPVERQARPLFAKAPIERRHCLASAWP